MCAKVPVGETAKTAADVLRANVAVLLYTNVAQGLIHKPERWDAEMWVFNTGFNSVDCKIHQLHVLWT
jgi:hypothetical protein